MVQTESYSGNIKINLLDSIRVQWLLSLLRKGSGPNVQQTLKGNSVGEIQRTQFATQTFTKLEEMSVKEGVMERNQQVKTKDEVFSHSRGLLQGPRKWWKVPRKRNNVHIKAVLFYSRRSLTAQFGQLTATWPKKAIVLVCYFNLFFGMAGVYSSWSTGFQTCKSLPIPRGIQLEALTTYNCPLSVRHG
ncbi:hypothetical protein B0H14DRAFT_2597702 [Mycena olivaceomarginata]|nr:hypothetical protein B0H14DRAFT_2597702 [Mycena olivaceomarginata]